MSLWEQSGLVQGCFTPGGHGGHTLLFGDASGGPDARTPALRRVGCAVVKLGEDKTEAQQWIKSSLPGEQE
eukprot:9499500-Lingulodinium_polyedra.AAC.1